MGTVAVIGAGVAGISAARTLVAAGETVTVYEARDRIGGRVWSEPVFGDFPIELGAEYVHGERVATWDWIREFDAPVSGSANAYRVWLHLNGALLDVPAATEALGANPMTAVGQLTEAWIANGREDTSVDRVFELWPSISDRPLTAEGRALLESILSELIASDAAEVGTHRYADLPDEQPETRRHFKLTNGYSALLARVAAGLPIELNTPVRRVRWDEAGVEVTTDAGVQRFDAAVVTLPLGVLDSGQIEFDPTLPAPKLEAITRLNHGHINKIILRLDGIYWPRDMTFIATPLSTQFWWRPGDGHPDEQPTLTAFFGGADAAAMEGATQQEAIELASQQLGDILGRSMTGHVLGGRFLAWGAEEFTRMGYSSTPPGGRGPRQALAEPAGALAFAGEATSVGHPASVHGALESGRRAAADALALAGRA